MSATEPLLKLFQVRKSYPGPASGEALTVLAGVDLDVEEGESIAIVGPSGSGKSTLLNIIGTLDQVTSGSVRLHGEELASRSEVEVAAIRSREVGFVFQAHHLLPQCTVLENVLVPTLACANKSLRDQAPERAGRLLGRVGLGDRLEHRPGQLSGGERQRVAVVRALINEPRLLLADEPTGALDRSSSERLGQLLVDLNREEGVTLIVVTHSLDLARRMRKVLELRDGRLAPAIIDGTRGGPAGEKDEGPRARGPSLPGQG